MQTKPSLIIIKMGTMANIRAVTKFLQQVIKMSIELDEIEDDELEEEQAMPTFEHSIICANVVTELRLYLRGKNLGRVAESSAEYCFLDKA